MINGKMLRDAIVSAANNMHNNRLVVDELNVFPVPDGDTGTNMSMTIQNSVAELAVLPDTCTVSEAAKTAASAFLRGARGNSGVILSLVFRGFSKRLKGLETANAVDMAEALEQGVKGAYKAVMKPTEGTMLTVARVSAEKAVPAAGDFGDDTTGLWEFVCKVADETLQETPEMLPVLKKAGVVDAGGQGLLCIFEGMLVVFRGGDIIASEDAAKKETAKPVAAGNDVAGEFDMSMTELYCTEFIINRGDNTKGDPLKLRAYLEAVGDSVVFVEDEDIIKVHVHTGDPGAALSEAVKWGYLTNMKIENMLEQYKERVAAGKAEESDTPPSFEGEEESFEYQAVDQSTEFGFVAVAAGSGVKTLFADLGVEAIVSGGQTMNPSTEDLLKAIHSVPAKTVFVLPNNKNIILSAEQTLALADRRVVVLQTRTIPQGLSAMLAFDPTADVKENSLNMTKAIDNVETGQITYAARNSDYEGHKIKEGQLLCLHNNKLSFTDANLQKAVTKLTGRLLKKDSTFVTLITGADVPPAEAEQIEEAVRAKLPEDVELAVVYGGQPVYYYIISAE